MSRWAVRHPITALVVWLLVLVGIGVGASVAPGTYNDSFALPGASSTTAQKLLGELATGPSTTSSVQVVWERPGSSVTDAKTRADIEPVLALGGWGVHTPYAVTWAHEAEHGVSADEPRLRLADTAWQWPQAVAAIEGRND